MDVTTLVRDSQSSDLKNGEKYLESRKDVDIFLRSFSVKQRRIITSRDEVRIFQVSKLSNTIFLTRWLKQKKTQSAMS